MRKRLFLPTVLTLLVACTSKTPEEQAMDTALDCYKHLMAGDPETFLNGRAGMDNIPESYREQLLVSYKQFAHQQRQAHQGIVSIESTRTMTDSKSQMIQVFLLINYADSTIEEIVVPMVKDDDGRWLMK